MEKLIMVTAGPRDGGEPEQVLGWPDESFREYAEHSLDGDDLSTAVPRPAAYREYAERRRAAVTVPSGADLAWAREFIVSWASRAAVPASVRRLRRPSCSSATATTSSWSPSSWDTPGPNPPAATAATAGDAQAAINSLPADR